MEKKLVKDLMLGDLFCLSSPLFPVRPSDLYVKKRFSKRFNRYCCEKYLYLPASGNPNNFALFTLFLTGDTEVYLVKYEELDYEVEKAK